MLRYNKTIPTLPTAENGRDYGRIDLATLNKDRFINLITSARSLTITPTEAKKLRDALIEAYPLDATPKSTYSVGARVTYTSNVGYGLRGMVGRKGTVVTILPGEWYEVIFTSGPFDSKQKVHVSYLLPDGGMAPAAPAPTTGRYIVANLDGAQYRPSTTPYVHLTAAEAEAEAQRLAKEHGGTFHVFRASFEASREKPVIPPVKTAKL